MLQSVEQQRFGRDSAINNNVDTKMCLSCWLPKPQHQKECVKHSKYYVIIEEVNRIDNKDTKSYGSEH